MIERGGKRNSSGIFSIIVRFFLLGSIFADLFRYFFFSELVLSFAPYVLGITILLLIIYILKYIKAGDRKHKTIYAIIVLLSGIVIFSYGSIVSNFYKISQTNKEPLKLITEKSVEKSYNNNIGEKSIHDKSKGNKGLNILFANIFWKNENTKSIWEKIKKEDPDIIALVEFSIHHKEKLYDLIIEKYPYTNINQRSEVHAGNIIFSKHPIENLIDKTKQGTRRYNYVAITYLGEKYYFYLVHTSAPTTLYNFDNRNKQLKKLRNDIDLHQKERAKSAKIIMIGDLNITPRSGYYREIFAQLFLKNITKNQPFLFTWKNSTLPFMMAHIDHIFLSDSIKWKTNSTFQFQGSDHKGFIIKGVK